MFDAAALPGAFAAVYPALFPALLLMLALCLHLLAEGVGVTLSRRGRLIAGATLVLLTLMLDGLLAYRIHQQAALVQLLTGQQETAWYLDTVFYLVLACGLGASLLWGAGLHGLLHLLGDADPYRQRQRRRQAYELELSQATAAGDSLERELAEARRSRAAELHGLRLEAIRLDASLHQELTVVRFGGRLKLCLDAFHGGWLQYALQAGHPAGGCREAFARFVTEHFATDAAA
ncbi:hypothetical protein D0N36_02100 [Hymenobacter lapidiphilus]|uniref:hypothetical protein n=1 Tax=Hymenobacter sp. CCM 8763 TaxID=2303334 RepID=UPI000E342688|nr:hypothetical protein [Hymenobacter sp. CCM 8763]RFP66897.1 hypothetical protein D0N36_02100 [Hymenobacter sp. CCM 8763]